MIRAIYLIGENFQTDLTSAPLHVPADGDLFGNWVAKRIDEAMSAVHHDDQSFVWVDLVDPTKQEMHLVAERFALPELEVEDALNFKQRAKIDLDSSGQHFAVIKTISMGKDPSDTQTGQTSIFVGKHYAITVSHGANQDLRPVVKRILHEPILRSHGPFAVLYGVFDYNVDDYLALAEAVTLEVNEREIEVFNEQPSKNLTQNIYQLKRNNIEARRAVSPLYTQAQQFARESEPNIPPALRPYFQDIGEHLLRVLDTVEANDSLLLSMLMASTSLQDLRQNRDMRKISAWVAIAAVPTMVAGIYGMNFDNMPELHWEYSYYVVIGGLVVVCGLMYRAFKKSGWL